MDKNKTTVYKGMAILLVVSCHAMGIFGKGITVFTPLGGIGVAIFLLLSGFGLSESWNRLARGGTAPYQYYWKKRFIAVWVPYIIIQLVLYWPFHKFEILSFVLDLLLLKPLYHNGWYLQYLFMWYAIFYIVRRTDLLDQHRLIVFTLISILAFFTLQEIKAEQSLSFLFGILLSERKEYQLKIFNKRFGVLSLTIGIFCLFIKQFPIVRNAPQIIMNLVQLGIKLPCGLAFIVIAFFTMKKLKLRWLYFVGLFSYELYIIHGYVLEAVPVSIKGLIEFVITSFVASIVYWQIMKRLKPVWNKMLIRCSI